LRWATGSIEQLGIQRKILLDRPFDVDVDVVDIDIDIDVDDDQARRQDGTFF